MISRVKLPLIASAFQNLAKNADKIGNLNISSELLAELITPGTAQNG
ncbi:hypothetical protein [Desulfobacula phenolica]|nr:hypothetical protein [Desulfobacula phenolica]